MRKFRQNFLIAVLGITIALNPLVILMPEKIHAATPADPIIDGENTGHPLIKVANQTNYAYNLSTTSNSGACAAFSATHSLAFNNLLNLISDYTIGTNGITFDDIMIRPQDARIILTPADRAAVKSLQCLANILPNFTEDPIALYKDISAQNRSKVDQAVNAEKSKANARFKTNAEYFTFLHYGIDNQDPAERMINSDYFNSLIKEAKKSYSDTKLEAIWKQQAGLIAQGKDTTIDADTLSCVTGLDKNDLRAKIGTVEGGQYIGNQIDQAISSLVIDLRVLNTLIYLVTPKDRGGAGHWRIKAARILQGSEKSKESDSVIEANQKTTPTLTSATVGTPTPVQCDASMTAADCGRQQNAGTAVVEDQNGSQYDAYFQNMDNEFNDQRNVSAHYTGQAVDISQVDDIRCTLVKKRRLGGDIKTKQPVRPIKLAWQTTEGWQHSQGQNDFDMMGMMEDLAKQSVVDLLSSFDENITDYDGDLTKANFSDLLGILGQSLMAQLVNSPGHNLDGYDVTSTLKQLGAMYLASYLDLPNDTFTADDLTDLSKVKYIIGRSAIEKKLGLPYGSLDDLNLIETQQNGLKMPIYNLDGLVLNVGLRKIEHEMGLKANDLDRYLRLSASGAKYIFDNKGIGRIVIENDLKLPSDSWPKTATTFAGLGSIISNLRLSALRTDPSYIDSILHIEPGTTQSFINGTLNSETYAEKVGTSRYNDTTAGLKYFEMNNVGYQLPGPTKDSPNTPDTWQEALKGNPDYIRTIGIYTLARLFGDNALDINLKYLDGQTLKSYLPTNATIDKIVISSKNAEEQSVTYNRTQFGQFVFREWLRRNLDERITPDDGCRAPTPAGDLSVTAIYNGQTVYNGSVSLNNPSQTDAQNTVDSICQLKQNIKVDEIDYHDASGTSQVLRNITVSQNISATAAISAGLEKFDLYTVMGYRQADGRSVFERIGSKILYYGIANRLLSNEERAKIDVTNTNPSLQINASKNSTVAFYLPRVLNVVDLTKKIKNEWAEVQDISDITNDANKRINDALAHLNNIYDATDSDMLKIYKIAQTAASINGQVSAIIGDLRYLQGEFLAQNGSSVAKKIAQINGLIADANALFRNISEIMAGHSIDSADLLNINQISATAAINSDSGNGQNQGSQLGQWQMALMLFSFLSGQTSASDTIVALGANIAEQNVGLPRNSLLYLAQNFEKAGVSGIGAFYQAIGQAKIEQKFSMPSYYFQGYDYDKKMPGFDKLNSQGAYSDLIKWAVKTKDNNGVTVSSKSVITPEYDLFLQQQASYAISSGQTPATPTISQFVDIVRLTNPEKFATWVNLAKKQWLLVTKTGAADIAMFENNIDDVVTNIKNRGLTDGIRSPQDDLLFRMGLPIGQFSALKQNSTIAWALASTRVAQIDKDLGLPNGYTKMLFTGSNEITLADVSNKTKAQLQASTMQISNTEIDKYVQMLNGQLLPSESAEYQNGLAPDYVQNNPYADPEVTSSTCPVTYSAQGGFMINNSTTPSNSFCYFDKTGRHCFQSWEEAQQYANSHPNDKVSDILSDLAQKLTTAYNQALTNSSGQPVGTELNPADVYSGLVDFVNKKSTPTIFNATALGTIAKNNGKNVANYSVADQVRIADIGLEMIGNFSKVDSGALYDLFTRAYVNSPLVAYKNKVGQVFARIALTNKLFAALGLNIDPALFDAKDFYDILSGDYSSLYRLGASLVDNSLGLPKGTTTLILNAPSTNALNCALNQIGGTMLGQAFGLSYFPLNRLTTSAGDFLTSLGQEKIEESLHLPRGTFRVDNTATNNLANLIKNIGVVNFFVAFQIPINLTDATKRNGFNSAIRNILGDLKYANVQNTAPEFQLSTVKQFLASSLVLSNQSNSGRVNLESVLNSQLFDSDGFLSRVKSTDPSTNLYLAVAAGSDSTTLNAYSTYNRAVRNFYDRVNATDNLLGLSRYSTYFLLSTRIAPNDYIKASGNALGTRVAEAEIAKLLGLDDAEADAATTLVNNLHNLFSCSGNGRRLVNGVCRSGGGIDPTYHNWDMLYTNLDKIFHFNLDQKVGLPVGTIGQILANPNNTFPILLGIGAKELDARVFRGNPSRANKVASFSGLFRAMFPAEISPMQNECHAQAFPNGIDQVLNDQIAAAEKDLQTIENSFSSLGLPSGDYTSAAYVSNLNPGDRAKYNAWLVQKNDKAAALNTLQQSYDVNFANEQNCLQQARFDNANDSSNPDRDDAGSLHDFGGRLSIWAQNAIAETVHDLILNVKVREPGCTRGNCEINVGIDMPVSDILTMVGANPNHPGADLRYLSAAIVAMGANIAMIAIDSITTNNCNPAEKGADGCRAPVPAGMRISYDEIALALFGLPNSQLAQYAAWESVISSSETVYKPNPDNQSTTGGCPTGTVFDGIMCVSALLTNNAEASIANDIREGSGYSPVNLSAERTRIQQSITANNQQAADSCVDLQSSSVPNSENKTYQDCINNISGSLNAQNLANLDLLDHPERIDWEHDPSAKAVLDNAQKIAQKKLQYDMMDIALWKLDDNIFPGFSKMLIDGNTGQKWQALARYIKNGATNGHLFGLNFRAVDPLLLDAGLALAAYFAASTPAQKTQAIANFTNQKFTTLVSFISENSESWLGFKLDMNISEGLLTGIITGNWGTSAISLDGILLDKGAKTTFAGAERFTLGGAVVNWGLGRIFTWADKALGMKPGQALEIFMQVKGVYKAYVAYQQAKSALQVAQALNSGATKIALAVKGTPMETLGNKIQKLSENNLVAKTAAKEAAYQNLRQVSGLFVQYAIGLIVDRFLGKTISSIEDKLGLVPGTLAPVVTAGIYTTMLPVFNSTISALGGPSNFLPSLGPQVWLVTLAMFVIMNLFGVYRVEYWCTGDGYYPKFGSPNYEENDITGMGVWGGKVGGKLNSIIQRKSIETAQYKARRLIGDALEVQYDAKYNTNGLPTIPIQIMTGRAEDVDHWKNLEATNVCQKYAGGNGQLVFDGKNAICDFGLKRMGLWQNPQTVAWTHIGF